MVLAGFTSLVGALSSFAAPLPEHTILILTPGGGLGQSGDGLVEDTERLLVGLQEEHRISYRRSMIDPALLRSCLQDELEPSEARRSCLLRRLPDREGGLPLVTIIINYTLERGAWQRMECLGSTSSGYERRVYAQDADHPRADVRASPRNAALRCITAALASEAPQPIDPAKSEAPADAEATELLADLNWQTCLQSQAQSLTLRAIGGHSAPPQAEAVFLACVTQEAALRHALLANRANEADAEFQRRRYGAASNVSNLIQTTYLRHNYD